MHLLTILFGLILWFFVVLGLMASGNEWLRRFGIFGGRDPASRRRGLIVVAEKAVQT